MSDSAFVFHLVSQTRANIDLLQAQGYLSMEEAAKIQSKLAAATVKSPEKSVKLPVPSPQHYSPAPSYQPPPPPPKPSYPKARVLWAYNEDGRVCNFSEVIPHPAVLKLVSKEPNDLAMSVGDTIDVVEETNEDWWTGRNGGKEGLFPSNYVEKLPPGKSSKPYPEKYGAPGYSDHDSHPHQQMPGDDAPAVNSVGLQPDEGQGKKKGKFGKFGGTVRSSPLPFQPPSLSFWCGDRWPSQLLVD